MPGLLCLQGGREFTDRCVEMDRTVVAAAPGRRVGILAGAARMGSDHDGAVGRASRHYERFDVEMVAVPDPRIDAAAGLTALSDVDLLVLPGGSPSSLLDVLTDLDGGSIGRLLIDRWKAGMVISGASAGAMVMCAHLVRPDRGDVVAGLGLVEGLALPHWQAGSDRSWPVPDGLPLWGLPECGGVVIEESSVRAIGDGAPARRLDGTWTPVDR